MQDTCEENFPFKDSLCISCCNRFSRALIPMDYESFGIDCDDFDIPDGELLIIEQHLCLVTQDDIEGSVKECTHFKMKGLELLRHT